MINKCIEQIYSARHKRLVLPLYFKQKLLTYSLSNSKLLLNFNDHVMPAGSYYIFHITYLKNWLSEQAGDELSVPDGVVIIVFDNEQVVGKRYTVKADCNTVPLSVITSRAYLSIDGSDLQENFEFKAKHWLFNELTNTRIISVNLAMISSTNE